MGPSMWLCFVRLVFWANLWPLTCASGYKGHVILFKITKAVNQKIHFLTKPKKTHTYPHRLEKVHWASLSLLYVYPAQGGRQLMKMMLMWRELWRKNSYGGRAGLSLGLFHCAHRWWSFWAALGACCGRDWTSWHRSGQTSPVAAAAACPETDVPDWLALEGGPLRRELINQQETETQFCSTHFVNISHSIALTLMMRTRHRCTFQCYCPYRPPKKRMEVL